MPQSDLVKTGIAGLDDILPGGIPRGNVILIEGAIGTGKTTIGVEFVYRGASQFNEPGIIVLFEVSPHKLIRDSLQLGWDLEVLERQQRLKIVFTTRDVLRQELQQADSVLLAEAAKIGARRIFIDGVARLIGANGTSEARSSFHVLTEGLMRENLTAILAVEPSVNSGNMNGMSMPEESIADTVIRLRMEDTQRAISRSIEIVKSRRT
jgi:circadian clock protein KaiC